MFVPLLALALALHAPAAPAPTPGALPAAVPATTVGEQFDMPSKITGRTYRIWVAKPLTPPPKEGYPVVYVLDGGVTFPTLSAQLLMATGSGGKGALVVGIGYPNIMATVQLRQRDLTPSLPSPALLSQGLATGKPDDFGGADAFHRFMMEELRPAIASAYRTDPANQSLIGYSLGGLFALHVMFEHPDAYRTYVAGSPSIWWNDREVLKGEAGFAAAVRAGKVAPRLLITSDSWEQGPEIPDLPAAGPEREKAQGQMNYAAMVDNAQALAQRLKALPGGKGYEVHYTLLPEFTHLTGLPASASRGLAFVLAK